MIENYVWSNVSICLGLKGGKLKTNKKEVSGTCQKNNVLPNYALNVIDAKEVDILCLSAT